MKSAAFSVCVLMSLAAFFAAGYYWGRQHDSFSVTDIQTDTVTTYITIADTLKPVFSVRKQRTTGVSSGTAIGATGFERSNDSLIVNYPLFDDEVYAASEGSVYTASVDTVLADSMISLSLAFHSPVPLHPDSRFTVAARMRQREINKNIMIAAQEELTDRFSLGVIAGYAYLPEADKGGFVAGVGICFRVW